MKPTTFERAPDWMKDRAMKHFLFGLKAGQPITVVSGKYKGRSGSVRSFNRELGLYKVSLNSVGSKSFPIEALKKR